MLKFSLATEKWNKNFPTLRARFLRHFLRNVWTLRHRNWKRMRELRTFVCVYLLCNFLCVFLLSLFLITKNGILWQTSDNLQTSRNSAVFSYVQQMGFVNMFVVLAWMGAKRILHLIVSKYLLRTKTTAVLHVLHSQGLSSSMNCLHVNLIQCKEITELVKLYPTDQLSAVVTWICIILRILKPLKLEIFIYLLFLLRSN